jgi:hypothetical protein
MVFLVEKAIVVLGKRSLDYLPEELVFLWCWPVFRGRSI